MSDPLADPARLRSLHRVCAGAEPDEAFDRFASLVRRLLDVPVALVSLVDDVRQFFPGQSGLAEPWLSKRETPLTHSFCQWVVIEGEAKVYPDARSHPQVRDNLAIPDLGVAAYAGMPLTDADGRVLGSLCAIDTVPREWSATETAILADLAAACSSELRLRISRDLADEARRAAEAAHDQLAMLAELSEELAATLDVDEALRRLAAVVIPRFADWCLITLVDDEGRPRRVAAVHHDPSRAADVDELGRILATDLRTHDFLARVIRTGRPDRGERAAVRDLDPRIDELTERLGYGSHLATPVTAPVSTRVLGAITLVNGSGRGAFTEADERTAMDIGRRVGLAIDNSRLYRRQRHVAEVLQQSLLTELPEIGGLELHARYLPAEDGTAVGGDWYDAFAQPDGSVMLAVGDVSGHDIEAAATMGQLRNLVRGDAYGRDDEPGPLLTQLDLAIRGLGMPATASVVLARMTRAADGWSAGFANAGHPPPILLRPDGEVDVWWEKPAPLLGLTAGGKRVTHYRPVPAGSTLLLYTDGLVEVPGQVIDDGIAAIAVVLRGGAGLPGEELCERLIAAAARRADDIAFLLVRIGSPPLP